MASERSTDRLVAGDIPEADRLVPTTRGRELAIRAERYARHVVGMAGEGWTDRLAAGNVPERAGERRAGKGRWPAIAAERYERKRVGIAGGGQTDPGCRRLAACHPG